MKSLLRTMFLSHAMEESKKRVVRGKVDTNNIDTNNIYIESSHLGSNHPNVRYDYLPLTFLNLILQSAFIPNTKPLSTLLISHAGLGKTIKLDFLRQFDFVKYTLDITPKHLTEFLDGVDRGQYKFLVIPDYIATLGHSKRTVELARSIFRAMIEEGIVDVDIFGMERHFKTKIRAGLISGITPEYFNENTRIWKNDGFLQRFLPFSYSHANSTTMQVMGNIHTKIDTVNTFKMKIIKTPEEPIVSDNIDNIIKVITYSMLESKEPPYRKYIQVTTLCMASAILRGSTEVTQIDTDFINQIVLYMNRKENPI